MASRRVYPAGTSPAARQNSEAHPRALLFFSRKLASIRPRLPASRDGSGSVLAPGTAGKRPIMVRGLRWTLAAFIVFLVGVLPIVYYRADYSHSKRLRAIVPGKL